MAEVIRRVWKSGPRKVRRTAWGYTLQVDGRRERKYDAAWSREKAQEELAARILERDAPKAAPAAKTFGALAKEYLAQKERTKSSVHKDRLTVARLLAAFGADAALTELTAQRIAEWGRNRLATLSCRKRPLANATLNRDLAILRHMLRLAHEWGYVERVPSIRMEREEQGRLRFLDEDEAARLLAECRKAAEHPVRTRRSPHLAAIVTLALYTGARRGEILGLTWDRVNFARGVLLFEKTKSGRRREVPMTTAVRDVLKPLYERQPADGAGRVFGRGSVRAAFENAVKRAGIRNFRFHDLRHTFASWLVQRDVPIVKVKDLLGHSSLAMTMRYAHLAPGHLRDAISVLPDLGAAIPKDGTSMAQAAVSVPLSVVSA